MCMKHLSSHKQEALVVTSDPHDGNSSVYEPFTLTTNKETLMVPLNPHDGNLNVYEPFKLPQVKKPCLFFYIPMTVM